MDSVAALITDIDEDGTLLAVRRDLDAGADPLAIIEELRNGMAEIGRRFEAKEYFLPDLVMSSEIFKGAVALIEPHLQGEVAMRGAIVMGTVKGDIHDIGKNIVATMWRISGFEVHDLGVDQPPQAFVDKARQTGAGLVGMSGLLTMAFDAMKDTVSAFEDAGMREGVKLIIGGGPVNEQVLDYVRADGFGRDPTEAVRLAERFIGGG